MFWTKQKVTDEYSTARAEKVATEAEGFYRSGKMHCAEAVLMAIKNNYRPDVPDALMQMASGFGGGSGAGCICGAVSGGTIALGLVLEENKKRVMELTRELHTWFKGEYGVTCCKVITAKGKSGCPLITGGVAGKVAELLG
jgi:C_GCAxxG_C_C family probable redox protein